MKIKSLIFVSVLSIFMISCNSSGWKETQNNCKYYTNSDSCKGRAIWRGSTFGDLIDGYGEFCRLNKEKQIISTKRCTAILGLMEPNDAIVLPNDYKYWGGIKREKPHKFGVIALPDNKYAIGYYKKGKSDSVIVVNRDRKILYLGGWKSFAYEGEGEQYNEQGVLIYKGNFKKGLFHGKGKLYTNNGDLLYEGKFKKGKYNGYGILYSDGQKIEHVWRNGEVKPKYALIYAKLEEHKSSLSQNEYKDFKERILYHERYGWIWQTIIAIGLLGLIAKMIVLYRQKNNLYDMYSRAKPFSKKKSFLLWLFGGWLGFHRLYLVSWWTFVFIGLFAIAIISNLTLITLFAGYYSLIPFFTELFTAFSLAIICFGMILLLWIFDALWIPYRIYYLTSIYYRKDFRELDILKGKQTDVDNLMQEIAIEVPKLVETIDKQLRSAEKISKQEKKHSTFIGQLFSIGEKSFAEEKHQKIKGVALEIDECIQQLAYYGRYLNYILQEARNNAYRNIELTKEIISYCRDNMKAQKQTVKHDKMLDMKNEISITTVNESGMQIFGPNTGDTAINTYLAIDSFTGSTALGAIGAIGVGLVGNYFQRLQAIQQYEQASAETVESLKKVVAESLNLQAEMLSANEKLRALYEANKAFIHAYCEVRNQVFAEPTWWNFLTMQDKRNGKRLFKSQTFNKQITHLIEVTKEYNKINKA